MIALARDYPRRRTPAPGARSTRPPASCCWRSPRDWAFIMKTGTMVDYAIRRTQRARAPLHPAPRPDPGRAIDARVAGAGRGQGQHVPGARLPGVQPGATPRERSPRRVDRRGAGPLASPALFAGMTRGSETMAEDLGTTEREIVAQRLKKAEELRAGVNPYGNGHAPRTPPAIHARYGEAPPRRSPGTRATGRSPAASSPCAASARPPSSGCATAPASSRSG